MRVASRWTMTTSLEGLLLLSAISTVSVNDIWVGAYSDDDGETDRGAANLLLLSGAATQATNNERSGHIERRFFHQRKQHYQHRFYFYFCLERIYLAS